MSPEQFRKSLVNRVEAFDFLKDLVEEFPDPVMEEHLEDETMDPSSSCSGQASAVRKKRRRGPAASKETLSVPKEEESQDNVKRL